MMWIWLGLLAAFIVIEALTVQLVTVWFAVGAFCSFVVTFFTDNIPLQVVVFILVSAAALFFTRPLVRKFTENKKMPTNADMYIGQKGTVIEEINNGEAKGLVKVKGTLWTARSFSDDVTVKNGEEVTVLKIEGVKLIVKPIE